MHMHVHSVYAHVCSGVCMWWLEDNCGCHFLDLVHHFFSFEKRVSLV